MDDGPRNQTVPEGESISLSLSKFNLGIAYEIRPKTRIRLQNGGTPEDSHVEIEYDARYGPFNSSYTFGNTWRETDLVLNLTNH